MNVVIGRRARGKTSLLIRMSADGQGTIITATKQQAKYIKDMAKDDLKLDIPDPITFEEFLKSRAGSRESYLLDEVGIVLNNLGIKVATLDNSCVKWIGE